MGARDFDLAMPVGEALHQGLVMRTSPILLCGDRSPETDTHCLLEPDHTGAHLGSDTVVQILWA